MNPIQRALAQADKIIEANAALERLSRIEERTDALEADLDEAHEYLIRQGQVREAEALIAQGWTVDGAYAHAEGTCDILLCTHDSHWEN